MFSQKSAYAAHHRIYSGCSDEGNAQALIDKTGFAKVAKKAKVGCWGAGADRAGEVRARRPQLPGTAPKQSSSGHRRRRYLAGQLASSCPEYRSRRGYTYP